ncbi:TlpA family protein disulfide reductase [Cellulophaga lytica]|uniref:Alkyl hydroperoxide reductase/ Thiol specific antioxidant/ Mal allergen n=1 Tax=Cellulophaga lytica (strain ATCC 23178 / DSM 7489 / JCM 8516 / NBRC 14961 / NCIMB 1423 / VKM B-1433 / Cy l20) TaxID=867900 RepID=F0RHK1_CELLC|nr:TlpA disulfide reductase family protein [Cellulophaga lytica]ADY30267.1 alkyl hydroperoxide reductase/ Thiol specific antioxidant/ Mal allergen [Cellulophaga lytica DSM 7489]WQG78798.1 TlpA disulfide reductase family protein [Cellulophaga lytica]
MGKLKFITIAFSIAMLWACKKETPVNYALFSGNISNTKGGELKVSSLNGFSKTINVKDTGIFSDTLFIEENGVYNVRFGNLRFAAYVTQGANINIEANKKENIKSLKFSGDYADLNNYFIYKESKNLDFIMDREGSYNVDESTFETKVLNFQKDLENRLTSLKDIPENINENELRAINYGRLAKKSEYEKMYGYLSKNKDFKASETFKKELNEISFDNAEDYLYSSDYQAMVSANIRKKAFDYYQKDSIPYSDASAKAVSEISNPIIKNAELYKAILMRLPMSKDKDKDLQDFLNASTSQKHIKKIKELYESLKVLDKGQPSPKFHNYENYAGGTTSLDDLKGKYVYIDVWATWCGPCKYEIPFLKKIEEQYQGKNIHFVSISTDKQKDKDKWKAMVADKEMGGIQLITDNDFNTSFVSDYKIMGIPQFILLDPNGNIVQANAPRPSDEKLVELFNSLNI